MHVIATAGHVDHGKSTLVRALTGMEPDRWAGERRRGMTIDLGFAWTNIGDETFAFVDVPGHERFVTNMLAGVGPAPAAMLVVAADEGWMPQTQEHVAALDALSVRHGVLVITRSDLADPTGPLANAHERLARTSLCNVEAVAVAVPPLCPATGLDELRAALIRMVSPIQAADPAAPVRLWVDRSFSIRGSGTVVTGTLTAGTIATRDALTLASPGQPERSVAVRGLQSLHRNQETVGAIARVAVNLRNIEKDDVKRGDALLTPDAWILTDVIDVAITRSGANTTAQELILHIGSAAIPAHIRPLGETHARLRLTAKIPLRVGDVALLRDPSQHRIAASVQVLDVVPPALHRRGAAASRARDLGDLTTNSAAETARELLRQRGIAREDELCAAGVTISSPPFVGQWHVDGQRLLELRRQLGEFVAAHARAHPLDPNPTVDAVRHNLGLPDRALVSALVETSDDALVVRRGRVVDTSRDATVPDDLARSVEAILIPMKSDPFRAPESADLATARLGPRELAAAERAGLLIRVADGIVLRPDAPRAAAQCLALLPQPFTVSQARQALRTTRRVAVPLLELLDRTGITRRLVDDTRTVIEPN